MWYSNTRPHICILYGGVQMLFNVVGVLQNSIRRSKPCQVCLRRQGA